MVSWFYKNSCGTHIVGLENQITLNNQMEIFDQISLPLEASSRQLRSRGDFNIKSPMMFLAMSKKDVMPA